MQIEVHFARISRITLFNTQLKFLIVYNLYNKSKNMLLYHKNNRELMRLNSSLGL